MDWIDAFFVSLGNYAKTIFGEGELGSMIADGAISGVGAVVMFLPNIVILFFGIALLERQQGIWHALHFYWMAFFIVLDCMVKVLFRLSRDLVIRFLLI